MKSIQNEPSISIQAEELTPTAYRSYGDVICANAEIAPVSANMGSAQRFNFVGELKNLRPDTAQPNLCVFQCKPQAQKSDPSFSIRLLEKHAYSTQVFIPMRAAHFLVVVCLGDDHPDLATLRVFIASQSQGITYRPGVWHHPLVALDEPSEFACLVWEDGSPKDCELVKFTNAIEARLQPSP